MNDYLTYLEYTQLSLNPVDELTFEKYLPRASIILDTLTRRYFHSHDLEFSMFKEQFKLSLSMQIDFYENMGSVNSYNVVNDVSQISIGRTSMSTGSSSKDFSESFYDPDINYVLSGTGLLYRGLNGC